MDPEKEKKNSDKSEVDAGNNSEMNVSENSDSDQNNSEMRKHVMKSKPKWDDREIDFDQLIF